MRTLTYLLLAGTAALLAGCGEADTTDQRRTIVLYTSVDRQYAEPIIKRFEEQTGHDVELVTDTEARKSAGLAARLEAERDAPQADVFWGNEVFYTARLAGDGIFAPYVPPQAVDVPMGFRGEGDLWVGNGLRVRVLAVNAQTPEGLDSIFDLTDPQYRGQVVMAQPAFGTTGGHVAALFVLLGEEQYRAYFQELKQNQMQFVGSNSQTAQLVAEGVELVGFTDNDDVRALQMTQPEAGVEMLIPDQGSEQVGTLAIPTTIALIAGRPDSQPARDLADYLAGPQVEQQLMEMGFAQFSVREIGPGGLKVMDVDFDAVTARMPEAIAIAVEIIEGRGE